MSRGIPQNILLSLMIFKPKYWLCQVKTLFLKPFERLWCFSPIRNLFFLNIPFVIVVEIFTYKILFSIIQWPSLGGSTANQFVVHWKPQEILSNPWEWSSFALSLTGNFLTNHNHNKPIQIEIEIIKETDHSLNLTFYRFDHSNCQNTIYT